MFLTPRNGRLCCMALIALTICGCPDQEPQARYVRQVAAVGNVALAVNSPWQEPAVAEGRAEWIEFRKPGSDEDADAEGDADDGEPSGDEKAIETAVRAMIADYNDVAKDGDTEELQLYYVQKQQDAVKLMLDSAKTMMEKIKTLKTHLVEKLPDETERIDTVFDAMDQGGSLAIKIEAITVVSDTEATGKLPNPMMPMYRFVIEDGEWMIEIPNLPDEATLKSTLAQGGAMFDASIAAVTGGLLTPDAVLTQMEMGVKMMKQALEAAGGSGDGNEGETGAKPDTPQQDDGGDDDGNADDDGE